MKLFSKIWLFVYILLPAISLAQETDKANMLEAIIESQLDNLDEETDASMVIEDLEYFSEHPININNTNAAELSRLYLLNDIQIGNLLQYINEFGPVYSIFELNTIDGFNPDLLNKLSLFIWFGPKEEVPEKFTESFKYSKQQLLLRTLGTIQKARGYKPDDEEKTPYEGNRFRYYSRYKFEVSDHFSAGITAEKDPGEAFFRGSNNTGFDFYSGYASANFKGLVQNITVGDYIVRAGQGLVLWQGFTTGKSVYTLNISKTAQGVRPYTSVDENFFFRGVAASFKFRKASLSLFYSSKNTDANQIISDEGSLEFTSLQTSGYHRTENEIEDERSVHRTTAGGIAGYRFRYLKLGAALIYERFNLPYAAGTQLYQKFRFAGIENYTGGLNYLFSKGKYQLFGEAARSKSSGNAFLQGAIANLTDQLGFSLLFRHFDKNYHTLWANTFAEGSNINNETGIYLGTKILPVKYVTLNAYSDFYRSEWFNYSTAGPAQGWDIFAEASVVFSEKFEFYLRYKNEEKEQKFRPEERYINLPEKIQRLRVHFQFHPTEFLTLKTRIENAVYSGEEKENGILVFQDVGFEPEKFPLKSIVRFALFSTESYNSRIYAYENDLLYTFSIPAYYGKGFRTYLNLNYKISRKIDIWIKIADTHWNDRDTISSGYNEISGNNKTELKFQIRLKI